MKKGIRIILIIVGILLLILFLATLLAPPIAKNYVNNHGEELTGRRIHIDAVRLNLLTGHVAVRDAALYEEDGTTPFVAFDTLDVSVRLHSLLFSKLYVRHLTLAGLNVRVEQRDTVFNFSSLIAHFAKDEPDDDTTASSWRLVFHNVALHHGQIHYADLGRGSRWDLNNLNLRVPDFSMGGEEATHAGLNLMLGKEGRLSSQMHYDAKSNNFSTTIELQKFNIGQIKPYLSDIMHIGKLDGQLGMSITAQGNLSHITELLVKGTVSLDALQFGDTQEELATCNHIGVDIVQIDLGRNRYHIGDIAIDGLSTHYDVRADGNTFSNLMIPAPARESDSTLTMTVEDSSLKGKKPAADFTVDHFALTDATFTYADHTLPDAFEFPVHNIKMEAENLKFHGDNAANITADLPEGGRAVIRWKGNISDWKERQDLMFIISNLKLTQLSPYLVAYLGQPFTEGTLSFRSHNRINHSMLDGKNHLDIYKASVGDRRRDVKPQKKLPLKAALFILKDKDEKIDLEVPVSGNINSPEFSYMKMVWKTLGNLLVKVATSPLRALGNAMGLNDKDLEFLAINPEQFDFTSEQYYHIESLAKIMQRDTLIHVTFEQQLDANEEEALLQRADRRNELLRHHLSELGLPESRYEVTTVLSDTLDEPGYRILSTLEGATDE